MKPDFHLKSDPSVLQRHITRRNVSTSGNMVLMIGKPKIGKEMPFEECLQKFNRNLSILLEKTKPTDLFIIGNILDSSVEDKEEKIFAFLDSLLQYSCKKHVISGIDERMAISNYENQEIDIIKEHVGILTIKSNRELKVYITDCAGNNFNVSEDAGLRFLLFIKGLLNRVIGPFDFLISSYVEPSFIDYFNAVASTGTFDYHKDKIEYLLIDISDGIEMSIHSELDTCEYENPIPEEKEKDKCLLI